MSYYFIIAFTHGKGYSSGMNNFKKPFRSRPGESRPPARMGSGPRPRTSSFRSSDAPQLFDAICSNCGKKCQVPFRPNGTKPVYCKNCFDAPRGALPALKRITADRFPAAGADAGGAGGKSIGDLTRQIAAMNTKIDTMLKILQDGGDQE
jgi:CxxC-x17-CxxC domain-containing protein